ncbi:MAG: penicillin acylase family protein [Actinomycetota bacterium]
MRRTIIAVVTLGLFAGLLAGSPAGAGATGANCVTKYPPLDRHGKPFGPTFIDCSGGHVFNIIPPGSDGLVNTVDFAKQEAGLGIPAHQQDQRGMYADLVTAAPNLAAADLTKFYKDASFNNDILGAERVENPRPGVLILRDSFGVPHIYGRTRADTEFGSGFASAEDRLFMMDVLRNYGRGKLSSLLGPSPSDLAMDCGISQVAGYSESELQAQFDNLSKIYTKPFHADTSNAVTEGEQVQLDARAYVAGVNTYIKAAVVNPLLMPVEYPALQIVPRPWKVTDVVATATLVQAIFAIGGGNEVGSALLYQSLVKRYGTDKGAAMWRDFRSQNDPEARTSLTSPFPYEQVPSTIDPRSLAMPLTKPTSNSCDGGPLPAANTGLGQITLPDGITLDLTALLPPPYGHRNASNELIVNAEHSASGHPIAVFGPQVGYFSPEILHEIDLHGPGLQARGASFPGTEVFVELGHGVDYAWSATSASADIIDERLEKLCNVDGSAPSLSSTAYMYNGKCTPMYERTDRQIAKPSATATNPPSVVTIQIERSVHGPIIGRLMATDPVTGNPIPAAVSYQRSTFGDELGSAPAFLEWNDPDIIHNARDFQIAAGEETGTFNWTYVDSRDVAYYMSGKLPIRPNNIDPNFPVWGTGEWDWQGFVPADLSNNDLHPRAINPPSGFFTNWNNKPAPDFSAADNNWGYGPVYRVQSLSDRIRAIISQRDATPVDVVNAMEDAGTVDLDGSQLVPAMAEVLQNATLTQAQQNVLNTLSAWAADPFWGADVPGAHRRDLHSTGSYDQGTAVAIMDELYPRIAHAIFDPWLDSDQFSMLRGMNSLNNPPGPGGSSYDGGWEGYIQRAMLQSIGQAGAPYSQSYCGDATVCASALQSALQQTIDALSARYGSSDISTWTCGRSNKAPECNPANDDIQFSAVGVASVPGIPWINRPTFQQVVSFQDHR